MVMVTKITFFIPLLCNIYYVRNTIRGGKEMKEEKKLSQSKAMQSLQVKSLLDDGKKLAKVNDLWYFVKSDKNRWIAGSAH